MPSEKQNNNKNNNNKYNKQLFSFLRNTKCYLFGMIICVTVVFRKTVVGD